MTVEKPLWMQGNTYPARLDRGILAQLWDEGVMNLGALRVTQRGAGANFSVDIAAGTAVVQGDDQAEQGNYLVRSTSTVNVTVSAAPGANSRIDLICLRVYDSNAGGVGTSAGQSTGAITADTAGFVHIAGTPSGSPVPPTVPASCLALATIGPITPSTSSIVNGLITDVRPLAGRRTSPGTLEFRAQSLTRVPNGWLECNGQAVSRSTYADLFAEIGVAFGAGNGTTTFNLPDFRDRFPLAAGSSFPTIGATGGAATHTLTSSEVPATRVVFDGGSWDGYDPPFGQGVGGAGINITGGQRSTLDESKLKVDGGGQAHNNMPPYQVAGGWVIRT